MVERPWCIEDGVSNYAPMALDYLERLGDSMQQRKEPMQPPDGMVRAFERLVGHVLDGRVIPFVGAGISLQARVPGDPDFKPQVSWMEERVREAYARLEAPVEHYARKAAGASDQNDQQRRQLFLSSHNETTTRQLIDLLQPPKGATMKVVRFLGWDNENGPLYKEIDVRCSSPSNGETRERLAREIVHASRRHP